MPITQTIWNYFDSAVTILPPGTITGSGTAPQLAYFTAANTIASTALSQVGTNDIIFNGGVAYKTRGVTVSGNLLVSDYYVGVGARAASVTMTLPLVASIPDGKIFIVKDESGQNGAFSINITPQAGEFLDGFVTIAMISSFESMQIIKRNGAYFRI